MQHDRAIVTHFGVTAATKLEFTHKRFVPEAQGSSPDLGRKKNKKDVLLGSVLVNGWICWCIALTPTMNVTLRLLLTKLAW